MHRSKFQNSCSIAGLILISVLPFACASEQVDEQSTAASTWPELNITHSSDGVLSDRVYTIFGETTVTGVVDKNNQPVEKIWTRTYAKKIEGEIQQLLPGPGYIFNPGDLLNLSIINLLEETNSPDLAQYDNDVEISFDTDEILIDHIDHELNVPHNPNNTNLHVHGLHVDPNRDDVTIVITPIGDESEYIVDDTAESVSDQSVKRGGWEYSYRIPEDHLPGTYWYHPHKHGSTAAHVENGLAGPMLIKPKDDADSLAPGLGDNDRIMILQEIYNYGIQQGTSNSFDIQDRDTGGAAAPAGAKFNPANTAPDITINGEHQPTLDLAPGQTQRWRFINAGANHRTFTYLWLGKKTAENATDVTYQSVDMTMVATDGITRGSGTTITANAPVLLGPGNRTDLFVDLDVEGEYALFKGWPATVGAKTAILQDSSGNPVAQVDQGNITDPYGLQPPNNTTSTWIHDLQTFNGAKATPIVPVLRAKEENGLIAIDENFPLLNGYWQQVLHLGGGVVDSQLLATINVAGTPVKNAPAIPSNATLSKHSPASKASGGTLNPTPAYASEITDADVVQSRTAVFDLSGVTVEVYASAEQKTPEQTVKQFSLNGRVFALNDSIGSPNSTELIQTLAVNAEKMPARLKVQNSLGDYYTNQGYYQPVVSDPANPGGYKWGAGTEPDYQAVTGLTDVAIVNPNSTKKPTNVPGMPIAQTAEEWLLINNSDIGHPFHIHINPFFITEIGQMVYQNDTWSVNKLDPGDIMGWVLNSWWDTIIIPPHGYVKLRQWINLPEQSSDSSIYADNVNRSGSWVYHCHILRHEDRGMMMLVATQQQRDFDLVGTWTDPDGFQTKIGAAEDGGLTFSTNSNVWWSKGTGEWSGYQPFSGTQTLSNYDGSLSQTLGFTANASGTEIAFGNGIVWRKSAFSMGTATAPIDLTGGWSWTDPVSGTTTNIAITQTEDNLKAEAANVSLWWNSGSGEWNLGIGDPFTTQPYQGQMTLTQQETIMLPTLEDPNKNVSKTQDGSILSLKLYISRDGKSIAFSNGMKWLRN